MKIEDQVISLEYAKRLKELDVNNESLFSWSNIDTDYPRIILSSFELERSSDYLVSAFTVAELGQMLPKAISITTTDEQKMDFCNFRLVTGRNLIMEEESICEFWTINYICDSTNEFRNWLFDKLLTKNIYDKNEANVRAKMIIYLIENGWYEKDDSHAQDQSGSENNG